MLLLKRLNAAGARVSHHGDFDPDGAAIYRFLAAGSAINPWRYTAAHYATALAGRADRRDRAWPTELIIPTPWDPPLGRAMAACGLRVEEETVLDQLLCDLG